MALSAEHRRLLVIDNGVGSAVFNFLLNGAIAWGLFRTATAVPLWGQQSVAGDTLITGFLLPFFTCLIVSRMVERRVTEGHVPRLAPAELPRAAWPRRSTLARSLFLGLAGVLLAAVPVVAALSLSGFSGFEGLWPFVGFKATFAALLAAVVTPLVGWWALVRASSPTAR
jgi:hypothetical protein